MVSGCHIILELFVFNSTTTQTNKRALKRSRGVHYSHHTTSLTLRRRHGASQELRLVYNMVLTNCCSSADGKFTKWCSTNLAPQDSRVVADDPDKEILIYSQKMYSLHLVKDIFKLSTGASDQRGLRLFDESVKSNQSIILFVAFQLSEALVKLLPIDRELFDSSCILNT